MGSSQRSSGGGYSRSSGRRRSDAALSLSRPTDSGAVLFFLKFVALQPFVQRVGQPVDEEGILLGLFFVAPEVSTSTFFKFSKKQAKRREIIFSSVLLLLSRK